MLRSDSIVADIEAAAAQYPDTQLILHSETRPETTTLGELWTESVRIAAALSALGVGPDDVVIVQLPNWRECIELHAAIWLCGAVVLPVVPIYGPREVEFIARQSGARAFVSTSSHRSRDNAEVFAALDGLVDVRVVVGEPVAGAIAFADLLAGDPAGFTPHRPAGADRALLIYTSGTTADPKGVQHSHATLLGEVQSLREQRGEEVTSLAAFPSGHVAGALGILRMLTRGTLSVVMDAWDPTVAARLIAEHRIETSGGAPIYLAGILDVAEKEGLDLSCLVEYVTGAANVSPELIRRADRAGITAFRCYGSSEHPTISSGTVADPLEKRATTDGRITPGSVVLLVDEDDREVPLGEDGEILTRGPELFLGYTDHVLDEASFLEAPDGRWFRTGDIGRLDAEGYLTITDRKKDIIVRGGEKVSSKEVEDVLLTHPAVAQAAAVGAPDEKYGERVCVFVVLADGAALDLAAVQEHFSGAGLARQKTPERLEVVTELPRTASGKVHKPSLRSQLTER